MTNGHVTLQEGNPSRPMVFVRQKGEVRPVGPGRIFLCLREGGFFGVF